MHYKIELRPLAAIEIIEASDWYESQKIGLGIEPPKDFYFPPLRGHCIFELKNLSGAF